MKTNKEFDIVAYIAIIGLAVAILIETAYLYKMEIKYMQARETVKDLTLVVEMLANNVVELNTELEAHVAEYEESRELVQEVVAYSAPPVEEPKLNYDYDYVLRVVAAESRGEPLEGQIGVAQCIRETAKATGQTPEQVVKVKNQYASPVSMDLVTDSVREACERVFINGESITDEPIRYFYSTGGGFVSKWHENSLTYVLTIGNHKFFKAN